MAEVVALEFALDAGKANMTLGELEEGFESMQKKLRTVGRGSEEFKTLTTAMAGTSAEIKNIELSFEGLDKEQIASELGGLAGGITDVTASLVLMGGENETIEQIGATIEKAMAISMGFKGAIEGAAAANKLYNNSVRAQAIAAKIAAVAQKALNAVMKANPIALIVAGITAAVVAYKSFSKESKKASFAQDAFTSAAKEAGIATISQKVELNKLIKVAKDDTLSKRQRQAAIEDLNKLAPDYLGNLTLETINTKEATAAIGAYVEGLERKARATVLQNRLIEIETELFKAQQAFANKHEEERKRGELDQSQRIERINKRKQAILDLMDAENNQTDEYVGNSAKQEAADKVAADAKIAAEKAAADEAKRLVSEKAARDKISQKAWEDGAEARAFKLRQEQQAKKDALMEDIDISAKKVELFDIEIEGIKTMAMVELETEDDILNAKRLRAKEEMDIAQARDERRQKSLDIAQAGLDVLSAGADAFIKDEVKREKIKKKLAIAQMAIDTARAISSVIAAAASTSITPVDLAIKIASGIAMVLANVAQAKALLGASGSTSAEGLGSSAGGAGSAGGGANIRPVSNTSTLIGDQNVTVVETDITNVQNKVKVIEESATF